MFRTIEKYSPTLLIDEADTFLKDNEEMRGVINSGHTRAGAYVIRLEKVGDTFEPVRFSTWGPKAIGMIGTLPDTIEDRSIVIQLSRKTPGEKIIKTGLDFAEDSIGIRARCRRWADDNITRLKSISVAVPASGNDRRDDNWLPLFTIANVIGGDWPEKAAKSMQQLVSISDDDAISTKLLFDIQSIFENSFVQQIPSSELVEKLQGLQESPWDDWNRGRGLKANGLARLLKPFNIKPKTIRINTKATAKGYTLKSFEDAFKRYIPRKSTVTPSQTNDFNNLDENQNVTPDLNVTDRKRDNQLNLFDCNVVTDELESIRGNKGGDLDKTEKWETGTI
jgi:hypothetical protein